MNPLSLIVQVMGEMSQSASPVIDAMVRQRVGSYENLPSLIQ